MKRKRELCIDENYQEFQNHAEKLPSNTPRYNEVAQEQNVIRCI